MGRVFLTRPGVNIFARQGLRYEEYLLNLHWSFTRRVASPPSTCGIPGGSILPNGFILRLNNEPEPSLFHFAMK